MSAPVGSHCALGVDRTPATCKHPPIHTLPPVPVCDLARVIDVHETDCTVQLLANSRIVSASWSDSLRRRGIVVQPCHLVLVAASETRPETEANAYEVVWRGAVVARVTSVDGERLTYDTGYAPHRSVTRTMHDLRPELEQQPVQSGQQIVAFHPDREPSTVIVVDTAVDGEPLHAERLLADWRALAQSALLVDRVDARRVVAEGYDRIAERYARWSEQEVTDHARPRYLEHMLNHLPQGASVLELGCGGGGSVTRRLAAQFELTGIDISSRQIERARERVPQGHFMCADMTRAEFPPESFDGVAAFYSFGHVPHDALPDLIRQIGTWLRPNGVLVATMASKANSGALELDWLGVPMYFSGYSEEQSRQLVLDAGLHIEIFQKETILEGTREVQFLWVVARRVESAPLIEAH